MGIPHDSQSGHVTEVKRAFASACKAAGIPYGQNVPNGVTFHTLRDAFATRMKGKVDPFTLQALLGHATFAMTTGYAHATPEEMERAVTQRDDRGRNVVKLKEKAS